MWTRSSSKEVDAAVLAAAVLILPREGVAEGERFPPTYLETRRRYGSGEMKKAAELS